MALGLTRSDVLMVKVDKYGRGSAAANGEGEVGKVGEGLERGGEIRLRLKIDEVKWCVI